MPLSESTTVLVVGAGPTGLVAAISLVKQGCKDIVVVDAALERENTSRALTVHAATLQALDALGCADTLIKLGIKGKAIRAQTRTAPIFTTDFSLLATYTKFPFVLLLPQCSTERVLMQHLASLGVHVRRPYKVVGLANDEVDETLLTVTFENGEGAKYVIGADGAHSVVRQLARIGFADPDGVALDDAAQMVVADVVFSPQTPLLSVNSVSSIVSSDDLLLVIPFPEVQPTNGATEGAARTIHRIAFIVPVADGVPLHSPPIEYLQRYIDRYAPNYLSSDPSVNPNPVQISSKLWESRFRTHAALARRPYRRWRSHLSRWGCCTPAGGQGMNLGIRDAVSLGPVIAEHLKAVHSGNKADKLLEQYASERHARAKNIIKLTKRLMTLSTVMHRISPLVVGLQYWLFRFLSMFTVVRRMVAWRLSGLGDQ